MKIFQRAVPAVSVMLATLVVAPAFGQAPPPMLPPPQLDQLVARIALYPDPLVAQILAAATYPDQIPPAAMWADQHHYLTGAALAGAIQADQLPWDPSVQALLPFPSVLEMMTSDMNWTQQIGNAFLAQQPDVMDAVQRQRQQGPAISATSEPTPRSWWAAVLISPLCRSIRVSSACPITIRRWCSSRLGRDSWSAARSASASGSPSARFSGPGAGARAWAASIGAGTRCLSTTMRGAAPGPTAALTCIRTQASGVRRWERFARPRGIS